MPYVEHSVFTSPSHNEAQIWRYMSLSKFLDLINTRSLYFTSAKTLANIEWFEGRPTAFDKMIANLTWDDAPDEYKFSMPSRDIFEKLQDIEKDSISNRMWEFLARMQYINCWHINELESHAMWRVYVTGNEGICIRSDFQRLRQCFSECNEQIQIGVVRYIDDTSWQTPRGNVFYPFMQKRRYFEYENELRAVFMDGGKYEFATYQEISKGKKLLSLSERDVVLEGRQGRAIFREWVSGIRIPIDLNILIKGVYIHPESPQWLKRTVEEIARKLGFEFPIRPSAIRNRQAP